MTRLGIEKIVDHIFRLGYEQGMKGLGPSWKKEVAIGDILALSQTAETGRSIEDWMLCNLSNILERYGRGLWSRDGTMKKMAQVLSLRLKECIDGLPEEDLHDYKVITKDAVKKVLGIDK